MAKSPPSVTINLSGADSSTLQALASFNGVQITGDQVIIQPSVVRRGDPASYLAFHTQLQQLVGGNLPKNIQILGSEMERRAWPGVNIGETGVRVASGLTTTKVNGPAGTQIERPLLVIEVSGIRKDAFSIRGTADSIRHYFQIDDSPHGPILTELHHPHGWKPTIPPNQTGRFNVTLTNRDLQTQGYVLTVSLERDEQGLLKVAQAHIGGKTWHGVPWAEAIRPSYRPPRPAPYSHEPVRGSGQGGSIVNLMWQDPLPQGSRALPDDLRVELSANDRRYLQPHLKSNRLHWVHSITAQQNNKPPISTYLLRDGNSTERKRIVLEITRVAGSTPEVQVKYLGVPMKGVEVKLRKGSSLFDIDLTRASWLNRPLNAGKLNLVHYGEGIIELGEGSELPLVAWAGREGRVLHPCYPAGAIVQEAVHVERFLRKIDGDPSLGLREVSKNVSTLYEKIKNFTLDCALGPREAAGLVAAIDPRLGLPDPTKAQLLHVVQAGISDSRLEPFFRFLSRFHRGSYLSVELAQAGIAGILSLGALFAVGALAQGLSPSSQNNGGEGLSTTTTVLSTIASSFGRRWAVLFSGGAAAVDYFDNRHFDTSALDYAFMVV